MRFLRKSTRCVCQPRYFVIPRRPTRRTAARLLPFSEFRAPMALEMELADTYRFNVTPSGHRSTASRIFSACRTLPFLVR
jgi:hypothetical protein